MKIKYKKGTPPHEGYYLVKLAERFKRKGREKDNIPEPMYWNGEEWQDCSDDDSFDMPKNFKPIRFEPYFFEEWVEVEK